MQEGGGGQPDPAEMAAFAKLQQLEAPPREQRLSGQLSSAAGQAFEFYGADPQSKNVAAQVGRGAGGVAAILPTALAGPLGLPAAAIQAASSAYSQAYDDAIANGADESAALEAASKQAVKTAPALGAYLVGGKLASSVVAKLMPAAAAPIAKAAAGTVGAAATNVTVGSILRAIEGEEWKPTVENLTADALFGIMHGVGEYRGASQVARQRAAQEELRRKAEAIPETPTTAKSEPEPAQVASREVAPDATEPAAPQKATEPAPPSPEAPRQQPPESAIVEEAPKPEPTTPAPESPSPPEPVPPSPTGIRNAIVDEQRVKRGLPERMAPLRRTFGKIWEQAMGVVDKDPLAGSKLVKSIAENPRPLEDWESALLTHEQASRQNAFDQAVEDVNNAKTEEARTEASSRLDDARNLVQEVYDVGQRVGTKSGQSLAARKLLISDDFSLAKMEATTRAIVNNGKPLSEKQASEVKVLHEKIAKTEAKLAEYERAEQSRQAQSAFENLLKSQAKEAAETAKTGKKITDFLDDQAAKAKARIIARRGRLNVTVDPLNVAGLVDEAIIGASYIAKGVTKFADWSTQMAKDFGDRIKPYLWELFERSKQFHDTNAAMFKAPRRDRKKPLGEQIKENAQKRGTIDPKLVYYLAREKVNAGLGDIDSVMKAVHKDLEPLHPGVTEREVRDAFSGYGKTKIPSKEADLVKLRELRRVGQLVSAIEDALKKEAPKKTGLQRDKPSQVIRDKMKELQKVMREQGIETTSPEQQLATANQARETALRNQIEDLDRQLRTGQKPSKSAPAWVSAKVEALRAERDAMKEQLREIEEAANPKPSDFERELARSKKAIANRTAKLKARIAAGDYSKPPKKVPAMDAEKERLLFENQKAKEEYARGLFEANLAKRSLPKKAWDTIVETLNTSRAILTSFDLSAVLRQGGFIGLAHPVRAAKSFPAMLKAFASERAQFAVQKEIELRPNAKLYHQAKLFLSEQEPISLTRMEEQFASRWANKIPMVAGSQRAYTTFLNKLRADSFDAMASTLSRGATPTPEEAKAIANFINVATGRGALPGKAATAASGLNTVFFAPRYVLSRFQLIAGQPFYGGNARTRLLVAKEYARYLAGVAVVYGLAAAAQDDKDPPIELDPTSSDFLKIRFGDTRLDPMSGLIQATVFSAREANELRKFFTQTKEKRPKYGSGGDVLFRFLRSKLSPAVGAAVNAVEGKNIVGEPVTPESTAKSMVVPISYDDILKTMEEQGIPRGTALSLLSLFGMGVQTYEDRKRK